MTCEVRSTEKGNHLLLTALIFERNCQVKQTELGKMTLMFNRDKIYIFTFVFANLVLKDLNAKFIYLVIIVSGSASKAVNFMS